MGERRVVLDDRQTKNAGGRPDKSAKPKKKKNCCCSCCLGSAIVVAVILVAGIGIGWYFGDSYIKANFGMSLSDCFSVVTSLYSPKESKIVTNGYNDSDLDDFYGDIKRAVFLKDGKNADGSYVVDIDVSEIYELFKNESGSAQTVAEGDTAQSGDNSALLDYVASLYTKENVDLTRLKYYDESKHDEYLLGIKDKGVAAALDKIINKILSEEIKGILAEKEIDLSEYGIDDLSKYVKLRQVILSRETRDASVEASDGSVTKEMRETSVLKATVQLKIGDIIDPVLAKFGYAYAGFAVKALVPNNIYITVAMGLDADVGVDVFVNKLDNAAKVDKAFKFIDSILAFAGQDLRIRQFIDETVGGYVYPYLETAKTYVDLSNVKNGSLVVDPFETVVDLINMNEGAEEGDIVTGKDLLNVLSGVLTSEYDNAVSPEHTFNNQHTASGGEGYDPGYGTVYDPADINTDTLVDYKKEFLREVSRKYLLDLKGADGAEGTADDITFDDLMALFGIGQSDKTLELIDLIDSAGMGDLINASGEIRVIINDRMMGAIVNSTIDDMLNGTELASYDIKLEQVILREKKVGEVNRQYIEIGASAAVSALTGSLEGAAGSIAGALLPERVMLSVNMDITRGLDPASLDKTEIRYNDMSAQKTDNALKIIGKIAKELDLNALIGEIESPVRDMLENMYSVIDVTFSQSRVILPDMFDTVSQMLFKDEASGTSVVSGSEIREMLRHLIGGGDENYVKTELGIDSAATDYAGFTGELENKYYLKSGAAFNSFDDIFDLISSSGFGAANFNLDALKTDTRSASQLRPYITDTELAKIFSEAMTGSGFESFAGIEGVKIGSTAGTETYIKIALEFKLDGFGTEFAKLLPADKIHIVATCYVGRAPETGTDGKKYYPTEITVNTMGGAEKSTLQKMLDHLGVGLDIDENAATLGSMIYDSFEQLRSNLGEDGFEIEDGKVVLTDFWSFLAKALDLDTNNTAYGEDKAAVIDNLKAAVQGLYARGDNANTNNYSIAEMVTNAARAYDPSSAETMKASFEQFPSVENGFVGRMADRDFAGFIGKDFEDKGATLKELTVMNTGNTNPKVETYYNEIAEISGSAADRNKSYMRLVVEVAISELFADGAAGSDNKMFDLLPTNLYITLYLDVTDMGNITKACDIKLNSLSRSSQSILLALAGFDTASLDKTVNDSLDILKDYERATLKTAQSASDAVGAVETQFDLTAFA